MDKEQECQYCHNTGWVQDPHCICCQYLCMFCEIGKTEASELYPNSSLPDKVINDNIEIEIEA